MVRRDSSLLLLPMILDEQARSPCLRRRSRPFWFKVATVTARGGVPCRVRHRCFFPSFVVIVIRKGYVAVVDGHVVFMV
jgi:hypothetical protein